MHDGQRVRMVGQREQNIVAIEALTDGLDFDATKQMAGADLSLEFRLEETAIFNRLPRFEAFDVIHIL